MPNDDRTLRKTGLCLLGLVLLFNLVLLWSEVSVEAPPAKGDAFHFALSSELASALREGGPVLDPWIPTWTMGFPVFHHYPPLSTWITAAAFLLLPLDALTIFNGLKYLLMCGFPIVIYYSARRCRLPVFEACLISCCASWISTRGLSGFEYNSYLWIGLGLYAQLWGMILLPLVLCRSYVALSEGRRYWVASLSLGMLLVTDAVLAYASLITWGLLSVRGVGDLRLSQRILRMGRILLPAMALSVFFLLPHLLDLSSLNRSVWEGTSSYNSYGAPLVLYQLVMGNLFDANRFPVFTLFLAVGLLTCFWSRLKWSRLLAGAFLLWLLLFFGRATWGDLMHVLPLSRELQVHRFLGLVQFFGVLIIGLGLAGFIRWVYGRGDWKRLLASLVFLGFFFGVSGVERFSYFWQNRQTKQESARDHRVMESKLAETLEEIQRRDRRLPGRTYAGMEMTWGKNFTAAGVPMDAHLSHARIPALGSLFHSMALVSDVQVLFNERLVHHYDLFNVRYLLAPPGHSVPAFATLETAGDMWNLWRVPATGYFALVRSDIALWGDKRHVYSVSRRWLESSFSVARSHPALFLDRANPVRRGDFQMVLPLEEDLELPELSHDAPPAGFVLDERMHTTDPQVTAVADKPSVVLFKMSYHPNWRVTVDGAHGEVLLLVPGFMGVRVGAGRHDVVFHYDPGPWKEMLLLLGVLVMAGVAVLEYRRG